MQAQKQDMKKEDHFLISVIVQFLYHTEISLGLHNISTTKVEEELNG